MAQVIPFRKSFPRHGRGGRFPLALGAAVLFGLGIGSVIDLPQAAPAAMDGAQAKVATRRFGTCHTGGGTNCVVDGDTFWIEGEKIRIADIDAPETHPSRCAEESRLGDAATERLRDLLNAGPVELASADRDTDRYGRKLRTVMQNGRSVGAVLVDEALARPWQGQRQPWCGISP